MTHVACVASVSARVRRERRDSNFGAITRLETLATQATTHATGTQIVRAKMTLLDAVFGGETSRAPALSLAFARENMKNLPREATRS